jgi:hypothetical protein
MFISAADGDGPLAGLVVSGPVKKKYAARNQIWF